jgi:hypothetical protein
VGAPKSPARRYIVSASSDGEIRVWDVARPSEPLRTAHTSARITALAVRTTSAWALASMREYLRVKGTRVSTPEYLRVQGYTREYP